MSNAEKQMMPPTVAAERVAAGLAARRGRERRFRIYGRIAIGIALAFLVTLFVSIFSKGIPGFFQHYVTIEVRWTAPSSTRQVTCRCSPCMTVTRAG